MMVSHRQFRMLVIAWTVVCASAVSLAAGPEPEGMPGLQAPGGHAPLGSMVDIIEDCLKGPSYPAEE